MLLETPRDRGVIAGRLARMAGERYVTAAGRIGSTRLYDRTVRLTMREDRWRRPLVGRLLAGVPDGGRGLDVGAGTGTLALALAAARPRVEGGAGGGGPRPPPRPPGGP